ncbi:MAG: hypothetical protein UT32_C0010G0009 [Parcubacteria group bacterium GW2011_GWC2_39_14]|nr:MAG: hypothetical protein UT32_C0010G0009 [Parcubacteria group bacterium GW2011_GWC2_39_14]KKR55164.1 MAG: hypothetical protein UT91_C0004G0063 [Parcubacteria group bacterium GW2011_GWA2_40_23]
MKLLKTIRDNDFGLEEKSEKLQLREASRAIVINDKNELAILYVSKKDFYKIPGGGIETG